MSYFAYTALDARGSEQRGHLDCQTSTQALKRIKEMGYFPVKISEKGAKLKPLSTPAPKPSAKTAAQVPIMDRLGQRWFPGVDSRTLSAFTRQLATLVAAGVPLLRGLRTLERDQIHPALRRTLGKLAAAIEGGSDLSEALSRHPRVFSAMYLSMVRAGETAGALEIVLRRLAETMEKAQRLKGRIKSALFYPCTVLVIALLILGGLMAWVVPEFERIFKEFTQGREMPPFTLMVIAVSRTFRFHLPYLLGGVAAVVFGLRLLVRTQKGRYALDWLKLRLPVVGKLLYKAAMARFSRTLGTLLQSGVGILKALMIVKETTGNAVIGKAVLLVHERVKEGDTITAPLLASHVFPHALISMVDIGEETGALPEMLDKIAEAYEEEVDQVAASLTAILEPILIVMLAVIVGSIVVAVYLPILDLVINSDVGMNRNVD